MNTFKKSKIIYLCLILILSVLISTVIEFILSMPKEAIPFTNNWVITDSPQKVNLELPNTFIFPFEGKNDYTRGVYSLETSIELKNDLNNMSIVVLEQPNNGYRISLDGQYLGEKGDLENGWANIWKDYAIFTIPFKLDRGRHILKLETYEIDEISILNSPFLIDVKLKPLKIILASFFNKYLGILMMGVSFILGLLLIIFSLKLKNGKYDNLLLGIAFILWAIYFIDFQSVDYTIISYLNFKKVLFSCLITGYVLNGYVIWGMLTEKVGKRFNLFFIIYWLIALLFVLVPGNVTLFRNLYNISFFMCLLIMIPIGFHPKVLFSENKNLTLLLTGVIFSLYFIFRFIFYQIASVSQTQMSHIGMFMYLIFIFIYFVNNFVKNIEQMLLEKQRADHYFEESVVDPLTKVNNRKILDYINFKLNRYSVLIFDLDNFKTINDTYGHEVGDIVLKELTTILKGSLRDHDYIIRLGGDEFAILLNNCEPDILNLKADIIWHKIKLLRISTKNITLSISCSGGGTQFRQGEEFSSALRRADNYLYDVKNKCKGHFLIK